MDESSGITVRDLVGAIGARLDVSVAGAEQELDRTIVSREIQKPGLVLTGFSEFYHPERLQFLGRSEIRYLEAAGARANTIARALCREQTPALLVTRSLAPPLALDEAARRSGVPILITSANTAEAIGVVLHYLAVHLAPRVTLHGVLVDIYGLGVLILGDSGIGKSESALELVARGHRLVADDAVEIRLVEEQLIGRAPALSRHHMEVRGLGIVNALEMFGITALRDSVRLELVVRLVPFGDGARFDRLGFETREWEVLGHGLPLYELPVAPGRSLSVLLEVAARRQLLLREGRDPTRALREELDRRLVEPESGEPT